MELVFASACLSMIIAVGFAFVVMYPLAYFGILKESKISILLGFVAVCIGSAISAHLGCLVFPLVARTEILAQAGVFGSIVGSVSLPVFLVGCGVFAWMEERKLKAKANAESEGR
ncbi:MAG: hypothetical protein K2X77_27355 [Candidatus Obscuribacterales bacterium]|nr:hypothetical protein [Candidatus Obscuribacterales bacterium]